MYCGDEKKFAIELTAPGFNIDDDNFDLEVRSRKASVQASKGASTEDLLIFYETVTPQEGEPYKQWYGIVDTTKLIKGQLVVIATAYITDANASGGVRKETAKYVLGTLEEK
jgi:hypothetical protein